MATDVSMTRHDTFLFVHVQGGLVTGEERHSLLAKILSEAIDANLDIVLHEDTPGGKPLPAEKYIARANFLGTSDFRKRLAYIPPPGFPLKTYELIENAAWNHARRVRVFSRVVDAIEWIERLDETA